MNKMLSADFSVSFPLPRSEEIAIHRIINLFEKGSPELMGHLAEDLDFRIDHYKDKADVSWQVATNLQEMAAMLQRLAAEIFPKGTKVLGLESLQLGDGWFLTRFHQTFYYGLSQSDCESLTYILSHESDGKLDYFRETVTNILDRV